MSISELAKTFISSWCKKEEFNPHDQKLVKMFLNGLLIARPQGISYFMITNLIREPSRGGAFEEKARLYSSLITEKVQKTQGENRLAFRAHQYQSFCYNYTNENWSSVEAKFFDRLKQNHIAAASQNYQGKNCGSYFTFSTDGPDTLRVLKFSNCFEEFSPRLNLEAPRHLPLCTRTRAPDLLELAKAKRYTDCTIKFQDRTTWEAHKCILAASSQVFDTELETRSVIDLSHIDSKTAQFFISYFYTSEDPFEPYNIGHPGKMKIDELLLLSHQYKVRALFESCVDRIGKKLFEEKDGLIAIEKYGIKCENEHLLKIYQYRCWQEEKLISEEAKKTFSKLGIKEYQPTTTKVVVLHQLEVGNKLGIRYQDPDLNLSQPEPIINFSWKMPQDFTSISEGWCGIVPNEIPFKFVKILPNNEIIWESSDNHRLMKCPTTKAVVTITDVSFP